MNKTLEHILAQYNVDNASESPILLPNTRTDLAKLFAQLNFKTGAEIGVLAGTYSKILCENNPTVKLFCIDAWEIYDDLPEKVSHNFHIRTRRGLAATQELLKDYNCEFIKKYSMDAVKDFKRDSLDFVYIDANHSFDYVMQDIIEWAKIVRPGGIVSGHDYTCVNHDEVTFQVSTAVNTYTKVHGITPLFIFSNENSTSWAFVKQ